MKWIIQALHALVALFQPTPRCQCGEPTEYTWIDNEPICMDCAKRRIGEVQHLVPPAGGVR